MTLIGLILCVYYWPRSFRFNAGCIEILPKKGRSLIGGEWIAAQTFGFFIAYNDGKARGAGRIRVHERVHVWQSLMWGPLFPLMYGGHWVYLWIKAGFKGWQKAYYSIWAEKTAYRVDKEWSQGKRGDAWR